MNKKGEMSLLKAWIIVAASLLDDILILAVIFLGLWLFDVEFTWQLILIVVAVMLVFIFIMHKAVIPAIRRRILTGAEEMVGTTCIVTEPLHPAGMVKIKGEYWKARVAQGTIEKGEEVEVVKIDGLVLEVRKK